MGNEKVILQILQGFILINNLGIVCLTI